MSYVNATYGAVTRAPNTGAGYSAIFYGIAFYTVPKFGICTVGVHDPNLIKISFSISRKRLYLA